MWIHFIYGVLPRPAHAPENQKSGPDSDKPYLFPQCETPINSPENLQGFPIAADFAADKAPPRGLVYHDHVITNCRILALLLALTAVFPLHAQQSQLIFPPLAGGHALPGTPSDSHAATLVELRSGDILVAWFGGDGEGAPNERIYSARLHNGQWTAPALLVDLHGIPCWNPVLFHTNDGRLWLYYKQGPSPTTWKGIRRYSTDEGQSWSADEPLPENLLGPIKDKPLVLANGLVVSGSSRETDSETNGGWQVLMERSTDDGRSFSASPLIPLPVAIDQPDVHAQEAATETPYEEIPDSQSGWRTKLYPPSKKTVGILQPTVVSLGGSHLRFYARAKSKSARIVIGDSYDNGASWGNLHLSELPNPNSGIDAVGLRDGRVVLIYNHSYNHRTPLNLAVSSDGEHFHPFATLENGPGQYSYPAIIQAANGDLLMAWTWRRQSIAFRRRPFAEIPK